MTDCRCGCGRYGDCSWAPYWKDGTDTEEVWEAGDFDFEAMPDIVVQGLGDAYDDNQINALLMEFIRLREVIRDAGR